MAVLKYFDGSGWTEVIAASPPEIYTDPTPPALTTDGLWADISNPGPPTSVINDHVKKTGDTMSGPLALAADPALPDEAANKRYVDQVSPIGAIVAFGGSVAPQGWHICDGSAHGSAELQAVIGSANVPDLRGRFIAGAGGAYAVGATGGEDAHTLNAWEQAPMYVYREGLDRVGHGGGGSGGGWGYFNNQNNVMNGHFVAKAHTGQTVASPHENRPPFYALTYIIRKS